jgi:hypothetical protein
MEGKLTGVAFMDDDKELVAGGIVLAIGLTEGTIDIDSVLSEELETMVLPGESSEAAGEVSCAGNLFWYSVDSGLPRLLIGNKEASVEGLTISELGDVLNCNDSSRG